MGKLYILIFNACFISTIILYFATYTLSIILLDRDAERSAREEVNTLKESIEVAKVKAETDTTSASMTIAR